MLDHMGFPAVDYDKSKAFYDKALAPLDISVVMSVSAEETGGDAFAGYGSDGKPDFWVSTGRPAGEIMHFHVAFVAKDRATVDAFYVAALAAGGRDNGGPGLRPHYHPNYYAAFVLDPDGNNIEAVCHKAGMKGRVGDGISAATGPGAIMFDHVDCPVTDIRRSVAFYDALLAPLGIARLMTRIASEAAGASNAGYGRDGHAGFWLSDASRKGHLHVGFSAATREAVAAFHAAGLAAGGTDNGGPGLRPYTSNYFAAYIIDPDGHNIEAVCRAER